MSEFTIRSESVDVEQIMKQIRQRILEKRGADYTEDQIRELATCGSKSSSIRTTCDRICWNSSARAARRPSPNRRRLRRRTRRSRPISWRRTAARLRFLRKLFSPLLKLLFNPNTLRQVLHTQAQFNVDLLKREARPQDRIRSLARGMELALLRGPPQPGARDHPNGHRGAEPAHEDRVAFEPP
jgi:hypothetical protein